MPALVDANTIIDYGMSLSRSFSLEHMTSGAFNNVLGRVSPTFPSQLLPWQRNGIFSSPIPIWQIVRNLQVGSLNVAEDFARSVGSDLIIMSGYQNQAPTTAPSVAERNHTIGVSLDIAVANYLDNPYQIVNELRRIGYRVRRMTVIYTEGMGWVHMDLQITRDGNIIIPNEGPLIETLDLINGVTHVGNVPIFGYY